MINQQPIEKRHHRADGVLEVHSIFHTIQGEGPFCGFPCVFVRLAGCNLQCPGCDTDYTSTRTAMTPDAIVTTVQEFRKGGLVVITGGEPFRQNIRELCWKLHEAGYFVQIESNGTLEPIEGIPYNCDPAQRRGVYLVVSPKTGKIHPRAYRYACALKYVVAHHDMNWLDGLPMSALDHPSNPHPARPTDGWNRPVYVQPMDSQDPEINKLNNRTAVEACLKFGHILQVQIHKVVGVE